MGLGGFRERADVLVEDSRIAQVGVGLVKSRAADQRVIDLAGRTLMPGMIDCHAHPGRRLRSGPMPASRSACWPCVPCRRWTRPARRGNHRAQRWCWPLSRRRHPRRDQRRHRPGGPAYWPADRSSDHRRLRPHRRAVRSGRSVSVREAVRTCLKRGVDAIKLLASGAVSQGGEAVDAETFQPRRDKWPAWTRRAARGGRRWRTASATRA